jgi:hypothetical protein
LLLNGKVLEMHWAAFPWLRLIGTGCPARKGQIWVV